MEAAEEEGREREGALASSAGRQLASAGVASVEGVAVVVSRASGGVNVRRRRRRVEIRIREHRVKQIKTKWSRFVVVLCTLIYIITVPGGRPGRG